MTEREREYRVRVVPVGSPFEFFVTAESADRAALVAKRRCPDGYRVETVKEDEYRDWL